MTELYTLIALLCSPLGCGDTILWTGTDRTMCRAEERYARMNPPYGYVVKATICAVDRKRA